MDEFKSYINKFDEECGLKVIEKLINDLKNEEYDTESTKMDLSNDKQYDGNININNYGKTLCKLVKQFVKAQKSYVLNRYIPILIFNKNKRKYKQKNNNIK